MQVCFLKYASFRDIFKARFQFQARPKMAEACVYELEAELGAGLLLVPHKGGLKLEERHSRTARVVACD